MNPSEEFRKHAAQCQQMAKSTRDPASKATWSRMAERWLRCADVFQQRRPASQPARGAESTSPPRKRGGALRAA
jgi:hypothetical protein